MCTEDGRLLEQFGDANAIVALLYWPWGRVRCLRDGRVLFTATEVELPTTSEGMPEGASLFVLGPQRPTVARALTRRALDRLPEEGGGLFFGAFELSPDQTRIAVAGKGFEVVVVALATGDITEVHKRREKEDAFGVRPAWRSNDELSLLVPPGSEMGSKDHEEVVLWTKEGSRCISCGWHEKPGDVKEEDTSKEK